MIEKSVLTKSGPDSGVRFAFPSSPGAGCAKQAGLNHSDRVGWLRTGLQTWSGRIRLCTLVFRRFAPDPLLPSTTNTGNPEVAFSITVNSQPPPIALVALFHLLPHLWPLPRGN